MLICHESCTVHSLYYTFQNTKHEIVRQGNSCTETVKYLKSVVQKATYESLNFVFS